MPTAFKDVSKSAADLLNNDFLFQAQKIKIKTKSANGVELTTEGTLKGSKGASGKLTASFKPFDGIDIKKLSVGTDGRFATEASLSGAIPSTVFTVKAEEGADRAPTGELCVDFKGDSTTVNASIDVTALNGPTLYGAGTLAYDAFTVGAEARYQTGFDSSDGSPSLADYNAAISYSAGDLTASVTTKKKCSDVTISVHQAYSKDVSLATTYNHGSKLLTVGSLYKLDDTTKLQGKLNSKGIVSANAIHIVSGGVKLISSVEIDAKNFAGDSHKFGLQLVLG